jgi:hypothetical protein
MSKKGGACCGAGGRRLKSKTQKNRPRRGGSMVADALVTVGALAAWKYFAKKRGGSRKMPRRTLKNKGAR